MIDLEKLLNEYKNISKEILKIVELKDFDKLNDLLDERNEIIIKIDKLNKKNTADIIKSLGILELEEQIKIKLNKAQNELKKEIKKIKEQKKLNNIYNRKEQVDSLFIYKKF